MFLLDNVILSLLFLFFFLAGIMFAPYRLSADGLESHMAVNYLSHCLLTKLLLPRLKESSTSKCKSRIINVASCLHYIAEIDFENLCRM